jgi:hypothetical protein
VFFGIHDSYKEGEEAFILLTTGHWVGFGKKDSYAKILLYDLYEDKLIKEKAIFYKNLSKKSDSKSYNAPLPKNISR